MTPRDIIKADTLWPYYKAMGISSIDSLPSGNTGPLKDVEVYCRMINIWSIKDSLFSRWKKRFYAYDVNRAIRMVAEDEGKNFTRILAKPAGYDDWLAKDTMISGADWVSEKCSQRELDINEIGRKMINRSLFRSMASSATNSASWVHGSVRRAIAFKPSVKNQHICAPTPYPKASDIAMATGAGGSSQFSTVGSGLSANPITEAASSQPLTMVTPTNHGDLLTAENLQLCRELEELKIVRTTTRSHGSRHSPVYMSTGLALSACLRFPWSSA
ncbi:hypothetical protein M407DRAFT_20758 [Tulasnella calospora MUT 4182]|uniref:Uncharacterized protein n=1 Tax=Tulasnella calospora MUT 4182 TaxID=1051891 RepID=A0A0C3L8C5_9AGAM|nr:hypothetical protein M407DRAFT_20758 [Tulasnella calospora MUT 4182]